MFVSLPMTLPFDVKKIKLFFKRNFIFNHVLTNVIDKLSPYYGKVMYSPFFEKEISYRTQYQSKNKLLKKFKTEIFLPSIVIFIIIYQAQVKNQRCVSAQHEAELAAFSVNNVFCCCLFVSSRIRVSFFFLSQQW